MVSWKNVRNHLKTFVVICIYATPIEFRPMDFRRPFALAHFKSGPYADPLNSSISLPVGVLAIIVKELISFAIHAYFSDANPCVMEGVRAGLLWVACSLHEAKSGTLASKSRSNAALVPKKPNLTVKIEMSVVGALYLC